MNRYSIPTIVVFFISIISLQGQNKAFAANISSDDPITIPAFFKSIISTFGQDFYKKDSISYIDFCTDNNLLTTDKDNFQNYYTFQILHRLFTCRTASNCSNGEILDIPYFWHWIEPNPRFKIRFTSNGQLLKNTNPPSGFSKYRSFAEIDRTPFLFLSDLVSDSPTYYTTDCDTFSSFGWCSEREMAFVALLSLLDYDGYVKVAGNHSWSVFLLPMKNTSDNLSYMQVMIDNTFDEIHFNPIKTNGLIGFKKEIQRYQSTDWYNKKAHSTTELKNINNHKVSKKAQQRIISKIITYLAY
ncbi:MAG: hypothetical protein WAT79_05255 [Saprospiraceae bacterium]